MSSTVKSAATCGKGLRQERLKRRPVHLHVHAFPLRCPRVDFARTSREGKMALVERDDRGRSGT
jgi:hypothetical protein